MKFNWKYMVYDLFKIAVPILVNQFIPEFPQGETITVILYGFAAVLGIDSVKKTFANGN